jgi:type II secretory pathway component PulK
MKPFRSNSICRLRRENASVLIIVLWIAIGMVSIALYFANSMTYELRAADNRVCGMTSEQAIEGAARYVSYVLYNYATNGAVPVNTQFACVAVPVGDAHYWMIGRDPTEPPSTDPYFGLVDEASKLNLNTVSSNVLMCLPNMTSDFVGAILDWRSTNGVGSYSLDYNGLGYDDKNAPFETVPELRLVYGASMSLLSGDDLNLNGVLDSNETNTDTSGESPSGVQSGLFEYCTVYTREPNFNADGNLFTNINTINEQDMQTLFQDAGVSSADSLARTVYNTIHVPVSPGSAETTLAACNGILDFCVRCKKAGMSSDDFAKLYPNVTTSTATYIRGRVNLDTADTTVLTALFWGVGLDRGVDQSTAETAAETVLNYREQNPDNLNSVAWLVDALGTSSPVIAALQTGDYVTARSYQFSADIAALGPYGRGYRRVKFIFDTSDGSPKIIYRQDLSSLGWALGDKVRQTWLVNATQ